MMTCRMTVFKMMVDEVIAKNDCRQTILDKMTIDTVTRHNECGCNG
jgi:hypothetical protein